MRARLQAFVSPLAQAPTGSGLRAAREYFCKEQLCLLFSKYSQGVWGQNAPIV
jgi:hypothetical protein